MQNQAINSNSYNSKIQSAISSAFSIHSSLNLTAKDRSDATVHVAVY